MKRKLFLGLLALIMLFAPLEAFAKSNVVYVEDEKKVEINENDIEPTDYIPVLMYHHFAIRDMGNGNGVVTSGDTLREQILYFKKRGYEFITLEKLETIMKQSKKKYDDFGLNLDKKYICITIDDGYLSNYEVAFPIFKEQRVPASIFCVTDSITNGTGLAKFSWSQAQKMADSNFVKLYNHTANHNPVGVSSDDEFVLQVENAEKALQKNVQQDKIKALAFPNGRYNAYVQNALKSQGFDMLFTVEHKVVDENTSLYAVPRINVESGFSGAEIEKIIKEAAIKTICNS